MVKEEFSSQEIERFSKILSNVLKYCRNNNKELNTNLLISRFNLNLITSLEVIELYSKKFELLENRIKKRQGLLRN